MMTDLIISVILAALIAGTVVVWRHAVDDLDKYDD